MKKLTIILLLLASCSTEINELESIEARVYTPWQSKEYISEITESGQDSLLGKFKTGAKSQYLIETTYGGQVERNKDLPTYSDKWYLNKKGRNPYARIEIGGLSGIITNNVPTIDFQTFEGFRYIYVHAGRVKFPTVEGITYGDRSFKISNQIKKRRIYQYQ